MYGLDLFSGIGGITKALEGYVEPVAYCESDRYAQAVLLSRFSTGDLPYAPIWDDVRTIRSIHFPIKPEIIYGGFPCQDISIAGRGAGLAGKRSGLFFEIVRIVGEVRPAFIFLENVPAIRTRGADVVAAELARLGYDARWDVLSASDVGANHRRERWWLLAHRERPGLEGLAGHGAKATGRQEPDRPAGQSGLREDVADSKSWTMRDDGSDIGTTDRKVNAPVDTGLSFREEKISNTSCDKGSDEIESIPDSESETPLRRDGELPAVTGLERTGSDNGSGTQSNVGWWITEPNVGRVANGIPCRVDRLRGLGNAVVPAQAREAFERLMGIPKKSMGSCIS